MSENREHKRERKQRVKPVYAFPSYNLGIALQIAEKIERVGGGRLTDETLAVSLGVSAKSSGFRLRINNARQFGLLTKQGEYLATTDTAKSILKPTDENEKADALRQAFLSIPLFKVIANRFRGQPLPGGDSFRNVLEREFKIESARVRDAERVLLDSAREARLITESGGNTYLTTETWSTAQSSTQPSLLEGQKPALYHPSGVSEPVVETLRSTPLQSDLSTFSLEDLADLNDEEYKNFMDAWIVVLRKKAKRQHSRGGVTPPTEEVDE